MSRRVDNWIDGFMYYTAESEAPDSYLTWAAIATISGAIQRRVWVKWVYYHYYPNIYVMLVGPPGIVHKSSTIRHVKNILRDAGVPRGSEAITKEALIAQMRALSTDFSSALMLLPSEFGTFLMPSGPLMLEFLTDIYDSPDTWEYTTRSRYVEEITNAYLSMLAGTTPKWISQQFNEAFLEQGFAARVVFVYEEKPRFLRANAIITPAQQKMHDDLLHDLLEITKVQGEFTWSSEAWAWWENWYENVWQTETLDYKLSGYHGRKPTHILKLSMILAIAEKNCELIITEKHIKRAKQLLEMLEPSMARAFSAVGKNPYASDLERIWRDIMVSGGMPLSEVRRRNYGALDKSSVDNIISELQLMQAVRYEKRGNEAWLVPMEEK